MGQCWSHAKGRTNKVLPKAAAKKAAEEEAARAADKAAAKKAAEEHAAKEAAAKEAADKAVAAKAAAKKAAAAKEAADKKAALELFLIKNEKNPDVMNLVDVISKYTTLIQGEHNLYIKYGLGEVDPLWNYETFVWGLVLNDFRYVRPCVRTIKKKIISMCK